MIDHINVNSEIGRLRGVLVHEPGPELNNLTPKYLDDLLFDEIPWLKGARAEHKEFTEALKSEGAEVYYIEKLIEELIKDRNIKEELINEHLKFSTILDDENKKIVHDYLMELDCKKTVETIISGLSKSIVKKLKIETTFSDIIRDSYPFYLDPMPNMYFTRDHGTVINSGILINSMFNFARRRETIFLRFLCKHHPIFMNKIATVFFNEEIPAGIEGGDILILNKDTIIIGLSERSTESAIEAVAKRLLIDKQELKNIIVVQIPAKRAYMHIDTVLTMVDYDKFIVYPGIRNKINIYKLFPGRNNHVEAKFEESLEKVLAECMGVSNILIMESGSDNPITAAREQWSDSTNTLALLPGVVVTYNRNEETNYILRQNGIKVIDVDGSELVRGRGGPHCMTMPLLRDSI